MEVGCLDWNTILALVLCFSRKTDWDFGFCLKILLGQFVLKDTYYMFGSVVGVECSCSCAFLSAYPDCLE